MGAVLYNLFIMPLEMFIELVFSVTNTIFKNPGFAIIFVSVAVQLLCFPLYKRADDIQTEDREKQKEMKPWLDHIKKTFKGDERFMMQQNYYRICNYKPIYAVKGSISLLLQIPFFIAAYNFLSNLTVLKGVSFLGISDLSQPDQLIHISGITLNLLPILMTFFNVISGIIYLRGLPLKDKIQTYGLAAAFLVILYRSPSGLVFYWTLNNMFSLLKNVFLKIIKNPKKVVFIVITAVGILAPISLVFLWGHINKTAKIATLLVTAISLSPLFFILLNKIPFVSRLSFKNVQIDAKQTHSIFVISSIALFALIGLVIPVSVIKTSPTEFISVNYSPLGLIFNTVCVCAGFVFVWFNVFYFLSPQKIRKIFAVITSVITACFIATYFCFGNNLGTISPYFVFDKAPSFTVKEKFLNLVVILIISVLVFTLFRVKTNIVKTINQIMAFSLAIVFVVGIVSIEKTLAEEGHPEKNKTVISDQEIEPIFNLSTNGKNVIVLMLDRAMSEYLPFVMKEMPKFQNSFDGFVYYPNTISYGGHTNLATPALFGGYEYTPTEINLRDSESLENKQNEALTVLPKLFLDNNYNVTVTDPPYAGYAELPDLSIYDKYDGIKAYITNGTYSNSEKKKYATCFEPLQKRDIVFYSIMKCVPLALQRSIYQSGKYWTTRGSAYYVSDFLDSFSVLKKLSNLTKISDSNQNNFILMQNSTTHEPVFLQEPDYENPVLDKEISPGYIISLDNGQTVDSKDAEDYIQFQVNVASLKQLGKWFEYLKMNNVYDNTRIIIVSDHGHERAKNYYMQLDNGKQVLSFNPLLLVKDFNSKGFNTSYEFMTNADTPTLAVNDIIDNPINPFTGNPINSNEKTLHPQLITTSFNHSITKNHGNTFDTSDGEWWSVKDNIFDVNNWQKVEVN